MTMIEIALQDAANQLSALVETVQKNGTWVRICRDGKPVADLRPAAAVTNPLLQDAKLSAVTFHEDPLTPLQPGDWPGDIR